MTQKLTNVIIGTGEVSGITYHKHKETPKAYMYIAISDEGSIHYEVFEKRVTPICINFENRIYSNTDFKEVYPKAKDFGIWAFTKNNIDQAISKLESITLEVEEKERNKDINKNN